MKFKLSILLIVTMIFSAASCEKETVSSEPDGIQKDYRTLNISSNPEGAQIYIKGKNTGFKTPCKINWIENTETNVMLRLSPYSDYQFAIHKDQNLSTPVYYDFLEDDRNWGTVELITTPAGADIYINGTLQNVKTPATITTMRPGDYKILFKYPEHRKDSVTASVPIKKNDYDIVRVNESLIDTSMFVDYSREYPFFVPSNSASYLGGASMYICTMTNGLYVYDHFQLFYRKLYSYYMSSQNVLFTSEDSKGTLWVSTAAGVIRVNSDGTVIKLGADNSPLGTKLVNSICEDKYGTIWFATDAGLFEMKRDTDTGSEYWEQLLLPASGMPNNYVSSVRASSDGKIWMTAPSKYAVYSYYNGQWDSYNLSYYNQVYISKNGELYVYGTNGVLKFSNNQWSSENVPELGPITTMNYDYRGNRYICGTKALKINKPDGTSEVISLKINGYASNPRITSIFMDTKKNVWCATSNYGLIRFKYFTR